MSCKYRIDSLRLRSNQVCKTRAWFGFHSEYFYVRSNVRWYANAVLYKCYRACIFNMTASLRFSHTVRTHHKHATLWCFWLRMTAGVSPWSKIESREPLCMCKPIIRHDLKVWLTTCVLQEYASLIVITGRSQWPRGLRHELSSLDRTLGSWVSVPLTAWMFRVCMRLFCVYVVLCLGSGLATGWSLVQGVLLTMYRLRNWKKADTVQQMGL
jgi:hypothetical protein